MNVSEALIARGIKLNSYQPGSRKTRCPKCEGGKTHEQSLSVTIENDGSAVWKCHRGKCGWSDGWSEKRHRRDQEYQNSAPATKTYRKPKKRPDLSPDGLTEPYLKWFSGRRISKVTLNRNGVYVTRHYMPQIKKETTCLAFPLMRGGELVNVKYRDGKKNFCQEKDAEKIVFGMDHVPDDADTLIWVEGEVDKLSLNEIGIWNVVSVPDGAPTPKEEGGKVLPLPDDTPKFEFMANCIDFINRFQRHVIAVDSDKPGRFLEDELARRIGRDRCLRVRWPNINDVQLKDANEVLVQEGAQVVKECIENARPYPIKSLFMANQYETNVLTIFRDGFPNGAKPGWPKIDELFQVLPGQLTVLTGYPSSGKSEFLDAMMINLAINDDWRFGICSFENTVTEHLIKLSEKYKGVPFWDGFGVGRMGEGDVQQALQWLNDRFFFIRAEDETPTIDWVLEIARALVMRYGIRGLVLDPYNEFDHKRPKGVTETEYISSMLAKIKRFAAAHGIHVWFVAHPAKPMKEYETSAPTLYDIAGSAAWVNKADIGISVHRGFEDDGTRSSETDILVRKVRFKWVGRAGSARLAFDPATGRYKEVA